MGTRQTRLTPAMTPMGMSCSVRSSVWSPARMRACAAMALPSPTQIGAISLPRVHSAATPMAPAPISRTLVRHSVVAISAAEPVAVGSMAVK